MVESALNKSIKSAKHAAMLDPLTGAVLTLDKISDMIDEMFEAEKQWLPNFK